MSLDSPAFKQKIEDIESFICNKPDAIVFLDEIVNSDIIQTQTHINDYDAVSRKELAFLVGLLLKRAAFVDNLAPLERQYKKDIKRLRQKLKALHFEFLTDRAKKYEDKGFFTSETLVETTFYEESGFYNDQPLILCNGLYKSSEEWIIRNKNFRLESLSYVYLAICGVLLAKYEKRLKNYTRRNTDDVFFTIDDILGLKSDVLPNETISQEEIVSIINSFTCKPGSQFENFSRPGDENILTYFPIIEIKEGVYWLPLPDMLAIAFYLSPLHWMREDKDYKDVANKNVGSDLEELCADMLRRSFDKVYVSVDIFRGKDKFTDIDGLAVIGDTAIVIQAKNKRMMPETLSGDIESFKRDFNMVAQQAYNQGEKSSIALLNQDDYIFKNDDEEVDLPTITQVFILCVSSNVYYSGAIQVNEYLQQKYTNVKLPIVLSIFDLDLLTRYLTNPYELIYYLDLRVDRYKNLISNNEAAPLSSYLFTDYMHEKQSDLMLLMDGLISKLDEDYCKNQWGRKPKVDKCFSIRYKDAPNFARLLESVSLSNRFSKEKVIKKLLSLPIAASIQFSEKIAEYDLAILNPNRCGFSGVFDEFGISYFYSPFVNEKDIVAKMILNANRYHKNLWVGFLKERDTQNITFLYIEKDDGQD